MAVPCPCPPLVATAIELDSDTAPYSNCPRLLRQCVDQYRQSNQIVSGAPPQNCQSTLSAWPGAVARTRPADGSGARAFGHAATASCALAPLSVDTFLWRTFGDASPVHRGLWIAAGGGGYDDDGSSDACESGGTWTRRTMLLQHQKMMTKVSSS